MEKILLVQVGTAETSQIKRLANNKGIRVISAGSDKTGCVLKELVDGKDSGTVTEGAKPGFPAGSLMVFCDVSEKHFNQILFEMRSKKIQVDLKAVLTPTNQNWTVDHLYMELMKEQIMMKR